MLLVQQIRKFVRSHTYVHTENTPGVVEVELNTYLVYCMSMGCVNDNNVNLASDMCLAWKLVVVVVLTLTL